MRRPSLFFLSFWIFLLIGILPTKASFVHAGSSPIGSGKRVISSYSGGTSVQERAVEEPEDEQADPDGDRNSNFFEFAFGGDPLNHPDSSYLDVGTYDNWARVAIRERMSDAERLAYISANSSLEAEYVRGSDWGGGVGGILYTVRGSVLSWAHYNGRGDVTVRSSATGALTYAASYEAYGTRTQEAGANADRQRANTKDEDPTGLLNEGMRYRDLETGLFISRDPMGFVDGPNVYTYVVQNPWSAFDPDGLEAWKLDYVSFDDALYDASMDVYRYSPKQNESAPSKVEYGSNIYKDNKTGKYGYTSPYGSQKDTNVHVKKNNIPKNSTFEGATHNHPSDASGKNHGFSYESNSAIPGSKGDKGWADQNEKPLGLVALDKGRNKVVVKKYTPFPGSSARDGSNEQKGKITQYDPNTKKFGEEEKYHPDPPKVDGPVLTGIKSGVKMWTLPNGKTVPEYELPKQETVPKKNPEASK